MATVKRFEDIECWQEARVLVKLIYSLTRKPEFKKDIELVKRFENFKFWTKEPASYSKNMGLPMARKKTASTDNDNFLCTEITPPQVYISSDVHARDDES